MINEPELDDPGPDLTKPGIWWTKIIRAIASDYGIDVVHAAETLARNNPPEYKKAIMESAR